MVALGCLKEQRRSDDFFSDTLRSRDAVAMSLSRSTDKADSDEFYLNSIVA
jgi:hypothetical protein